MHCAALYDIVRQTKLNVFKGLDNTQWRAVRKIIIGAILGTDMVHHFSTISKLQVFIEMNGKDLQQDIIGNKCTAENMTGLTEVNNREFMIEVFLHAGERAKRASFEEDEHTRDESREMATPTY